jgi:hypothetical protein
MYKKEGTRKGTKGKWGRDGGDQKSRGEESMCRIRGVQRGEWEWDGWGDRTSEETGSADDGSRGEMRTRRRKPKETRRREYPPPMRGPEGRVAKETGSADDKSRREMQTRRWRKRSKWSEVREKEGGEMDEMSRVSLFYITHNESRPSIKSTVHGVAPARWA